LQTSIRSVLHSGQLSALARSSGFLQRQSKLKPAEFIDTLLFSGHDHSRLSLQDQCNDLSQQHRRSLSKVGLHKRFNERAVDFLKSVLATQMALKLDNGQSANWQPFSRVLIADSTKFTLPERFKEEYPGFKNFGIASIMNIQYAFDLKHGAWETLELTRATQNDQTYSKKTLNNITKDELHIRDLGFVTMSYLKKVVSEKAFFLNRLHPQWKPVQCATGKPVDWTALYRKMQHNSDAPFETTVMIGTGEDAFCCRLIAVPVPEKVWTERIRIAQQRAKSQHTTLSDEYRARCKFSIFITNTAVEALGSAAIIKLYRLRWQIELIFKTWKSLLDINKTKPVKKERLECQLIAKFIWILLNWKIFRCIDSFIQNRSRNCACSIWKFFKQARQIGYALRNMINGKIDLKLWFETFIFPVVKHLLIEPKKNHKPGFMIVNDIFNPLS
jgi:hypothetical protein